MSAYDFVLDTTIPDKGEILTRMSLWWFDQLKGLIANHVVATDVPAEVAGRAVICEPLDMYPVECVARGYLTGSGLLDYRRTGEVCGIALPAGLEDGSRLPEPIFTPATKADRGRARRERRLRSSRRGGRRRRGRRAAELTMAVYEHAHDLARERGIILADTKLEFGARPDGTTVLADEVLTPDSSRFWPAVEWQPGRAQESYDKQIVRDWLTSDARAGTARVARRRRRCRPRSWSGRERGTSRPTSCSPGSGSDSSSLPDHRRLRRTPHRCLRLSRRPPQPARVAVLAAVGDPGRPGCRTAPRHEVARDDHGRRAPAARDHPLRPARQLGRARHLARHRRDPGADLRGAEDGLPCGGRGRGLRPSCVRRTRGRRREAGRPRVGADLRKAADPPAGPDPTIGYPWEKPG